MKKDLQFQDEEILLLFHRGKYNKAMKIIMNEYGNDIYGFILMLTKNEDDANDISQETFIKVFKNLGKFKGDSELKTWLISIAKNTTYSFLKSKNYYISQEDYELNDNTFKKLEGQNITTNQINILNRVSSLSLTLKTPIVMYFYTNCSYDEISKIMNVSINTIKAQIRRAKIELSNIYKNKGIKNEL